MRHVTVTVPHGVGDAFWAYQKLEPYFDRLDVNLGVTSPSVVQLRAMAWVALLPKVGAVDCRVYGPAAYDAFVARRHPVDALLEGYRSGRRDFEYAVNRPLEEGVRLEAVDPGHPPAEPPALPAAPVEGAPDPGSYLTLYVSGDSCRGQRPGRVWSLAQWDEFVGLVYDRYGLGDTPLVLVGASYDRDAALALGGLLGRRGRRASVHIELRPAQVVGLIGRGRAFLGYQSGLGVVADWLGVRQLMVYFDELSAMRYSWCRPGHAGTVYLAELFSSTPAAVAAGLPDGWLGPGPAARAP